MFEFPLFYQPPVWIRSPRHQPGSPWGQIQQREEGLFGGSTNTSLISGFLVYWSQLVLLGTSLVAQMVKRLPTMQETLVQSLGQEELLEKGMATHSSTLAWKIPWTEEPSRLQSMGSQRVRHNWVTSLSLFTFMHWRRRWQPTPVFLPGESQGQGSLVGCRLWGHTELDTTEAI